MPTQLYFLTSLESWEVSQHGGNTCLTCKPVFWCFCPIVFGVHVPICASPHCTNQSSANHVFTLSLGVGGSWPQTSTTGYRGETGAPGPLLLWAMFWYFALGNGAGTELVARKTKHPEAECGAWGLTSLCLSLSYPFLQLCYIGLLTSVWASACSSINGHDNSNSIELWWALDVMVQSLPHSKGSKNMN